MTWRDDEKPTLSARDLRYTFGRDAQAVEVLHGVSLDLYAGELVLLMGPSGSGKTTLLGILSGLVRPTSGQVIALGQDLWRLGDTARENFRRQNCGFVFQGYNLFPALTARQQLEMVPCWGTGMSPAEAEPLVEDMLEQLGLDQRGDARPEQLSGGEKQRVAIGRALIKEPAICFADEPTSALNWSWGEQVIGLLRRAADRGTTVLVVAHDDRLAPFADRVLHLQEGRLLEPSAEGGRP